MRVLALQIATYQTGTGSAAIAEGLALEARAAWLDAAAVRSQGAVYTPDHLAQYVAETLLRFYHRYDGEAGADRPIAVLDPACGDGQLLCAMHTALSKTRVSGFRLVGSDVDAHALSAARSRLGHAASLVHTDALLPRGNDNPAGAWVSVLQDLGIDGVDLMVANPPWGATPQATRFEYEAAGYSLAKGQYDSSDLFIELATRVVRPGGLFAFIVPDSLFAIERESLRKLLLSRTQILYVARMGEGLFESVFRGCAVVVCRNGLLEAKSTTRCLRLNPEWRRRILTGDASLHQAEQELAHDVPTARFRANPGCAIDIDVESADAGLIARLRCTGASIASYLESSRGVELSKYGRVVHCPVCGQWSPRPKSIEGCPRCGQTASALVDDVMVARQPVDGYEPFIVGEDVGRHVIKSNRWIDPGRTGINYKPKHLYSEPKLLVRKTGVGISASMDYSGAYTNQVVYVFRRHASLPDWVPIEYAAALICSRAAYYHLVKTHGETEWRSHPYVTQKHILDLPAPSPDRVVAHRADVQRTAEILRSESRPGSALSPAADAELEAIVARTLGLNRADYERIYAVLASLQSLAPVRALAAVALDDIF